MTSALVVFFAASAWAQSSFFVQEVLPAANNQPPARMTISAWSAVQLMPGFLGWASDVGLNRRIDQEVEKLRSQIQKAMPAFGGVLVAVGVQESRPDDNGNVQRSFLVATVEGGGPAAQALVKKYIESARIDMDAAPGFVRRDAFLWVTKK